MGFFTSLVSATVKTALTPVAIVKDAVNIVIDQEPETVSNLLGSAADDISQAASDLGDGDIL